MRFKPLVKTLLLSLLCTCGLAKLTAQEEARIEYFTVNDGLSAREINDLYIGDDGFLWVATTDGLNRFDGQGFTKFGRGTADRPGISEKSIRHIDVDNEGNFVLTFRNFYGYFDRFDPKTQEVRQVQLVPSTGVVGYPRAIATDKFGRTFVVTIGLTGTYLYEYTPHRRDPTNQFTVIHYNANDAWSTLTPRVELLPLSNGQFVMYDEEHGFRYLGANGNPIGALFSRTAGQRRLYAFAEAPGGTVYFSFRDGYPLFRWLPGGRRTPTPVAGLDDGLSYPKISIDQLGQLLFHATEDILGDAFPQEYYLVDTSGQFSLYESAMPTGRAVTAATALNFNETIYLGLQEGLGVIERYTNSVRNYLTNRAADKLNEYEFGGVCQAADGTVYLLERGGNIYTAGQNGAPPDSLSLKLEEDSTRTVTFRGGSGLIYDPEYNSLWATALPVGRARGGLLIHYDLDTKRARVYRSEYALGDLVQTTDGRTFIAATDARRVGLLLEFNEITEDFVVQRNKAESALQLSGYRINKLAWVDDRLLLATEHRGLLAYDVDEESLTSITEMADPEGGVVTEDVIHNVISHAGAYWLGTDDGLWKISPEGEELRRFGRRDGMSSNVVYGILPDTSGGLWVSTDNGLTHLPASFDPDDIKRYYRDNGLPSNQFSPVSYHATGKGLYYFGTDNGLAVFTEADFSPQTTGADVMFTRVAVFGRNKTRVIDSDLKSLKQVTVFAREKSVAVSFALPAGQLPSSTLFRYQLEGFNDDWVPLTNERTIRFNNLAAGSYTLRVQGAGANGNFGEQETKLDINVRQFLYERVWFQGLVVLLFAVLLFWVLQSKLRERLRNEQLRTQLSSDIHDEVSGLLAGISLQAELLKSRTDDAKMESKLDNVGEAARSAMSKMSDVIWSIDSRRDTIGNLLQRMQEHADQVLLPIDIRYTFKAEGFDETQDLSGNIRQDLYFIFKEAINNIARHSNATEVEIELSQPGQVFELYIRDNGQKPPPQYVALPGSDPASSDRAQTVNRVKREKSGQGKDNMRMRAGRLKGTISIDDGKGYTLVFRMKKL